MGRTEAAPIKPLERNEIHYIGRSDENGNAEGIYYPVSRPVFPQT